MTISPVLIIIVTAILIATAFLYIINRPKKPIFTGVFLFLLLICVFFTFALNIELSSTNTMLNSDNNILKVICHFITMESEPTSQMLLDSFNLFCKLDIALIVIILITSVLEMKVLFKTTPNTTNT
ncbi:MAG: hypothetical protein UHK60_01590 [Acutalibacteraceae bacterium]|nr:hypothetical protein [Acutalibacteraceae bacterium]